MTSLAYTGWTRSVLLVPAVALALAHDPARAADRIWSGSVNGSGYWADASNWGGIAPASHDSLFFSGNTGLINTNNDAPNKAFQGITFNTGAGPFCLYGNPIVLESGLTNRSAWTQTNNLDMGIGTVTVSAAGGGDLVLNGTLSSPGGSLTKIGTGTLWLSGSNTYAGGTTIRGGTIAFRDTDHLGAGGAGLVLDGGSLQVGNLVTLNNRTVWLGAGGGTFSVDQLSTLTVTNDITGPGSLVHRFNKVSTDCG